jgi:hypothetical protein
MRRSFKAFNKKQKEETGKYLCMPKPCNSCPFTKSTQQRLLKSKWLGERNFAKIREAANTDPNDETYKNGFVCHNNGNCQCAGYLAMREKEELPIAFKTAAIMQGMYFDIDIPDDTLSTEEVREFYTAENARVLINELLNQ